MKNNFFKEKRAEKRSVGAVVGSVRRNSYQGSRPLSKADQLRIRQNRLIAQSHPDFLEDRRSKRKQFLDDGFEVFTDDDEEQQQSMTANAYKSKKSAKKRGTAEQQADELFRDIRQGDAIDEITDDEEGEEEGMEEEQQNALDEEQEDGEDQQGDDNDGVGSEMSEDDEADDDEEEDDDAGAPPEEFSSTIRSKHFGIEEEEEDETNELENDDEQLLNDCVKTVGQNRRKLSKKKRDAMKRVEKVAAGQYTVAMGGAQFEVIALGSTTDMDGIGPCFPPIAQITLRERLLQISTAKKRSKRYRMTTDKRPKFVKR